MARSTGRRCWRWSPNLAPAADITGPQSRKASARGYSLRRIDRNAHIDEIHAIHTSLPERQGRPMDDGYLVRRGAYPDEQRHFFDNVEPSRDAWGIAVCCGTSSMVRTRAVEAM